MANTTISNLPVAVGLTGQEQIAADQSGTTVRVSVSQIGVYAGGNLGVLTIATLPSAAVSQGLSAFVTNSSQAASGNFGAVLSSTTGSNFVSVYSNGVNWIIG